MSEKPITDDAKPEVVLLSLLECANAWDGSARLLGNVRAIDIQRAIPVALDALKKVGSVTVPASAELVADRAGAPAQDKNSHVSLSASVERGEEQDEKAKAFARSDQSGASTADPRDHHRGDSIRGEE